MLIKTGDPNLLYGWDEFEKKREQVFYLLSPKATSSLSTFKAPVICIRTPHISYSAVNWAGPISKISLHNSFFSLKTTDVFKGDG